MKNIYMVHVSIRIHNSQSVRHLCMLFGYSLPYFL